MKFKQILFTFIISTMFLACFFNTPALNEYSYKPLDKFQNNLFSLKVLGSYGNKYFILSYSKSMLIDEVILCSKVLSNDDECDKMLKDRDFLFGERAYLKTIPMSNRKYKRISEKDTVVINVKSQGNLIDLKFIKHIL